MGNKLLDNIEHLQCRLAGKGCILIRTCDDENTWFVNCHVWKDVEKFNADTVHNNGIDNQISIYRNYVTDLQEAIENCIKLLNYYQKENGISWY